MLHDPVRGHPGSKGLRYRDLVILNAGAPPPNEALQQARTAIFLAHLEPFLPEERLLDEAVGEDARPRSSSA